MNPIIIVITPKSLVILALAALITIAIRAYIRSRQAAEPEVQTNWETWRPK